MGIKHFIHEKIKEFNPLDLETFRMEVKNLPQNFEGFRMVHISDTHLPRMAVLSGYLTYRVKQQNPDIILLTGDIVDRPAQVMTSGMKQLCKKLAKIAPTYAISGNHETTSGQIKDWYKVLEQTQVKLLDNRHHLIIRDGGSMALIGLEDNLPYQTDFIDHPEIRESFFRLLLVHRPHHWEKHYPQDEGLAPHLILSGHVHGGQVRLPFIGGLFSPDTGFFPKYDSGMYRTATQGKLIVSRGLVSAIKPVRINNRPHMPVIILTKATDSE